VEFNPADFFEIVHNWNLSFHLSKLLTIITSIFGIATYQNFQVFKQESVFFTTTDVSLF